MLRRYKFSIPAFIWVVLMGALAITSSPLSAQIQPDLLTATSFSVLAGQTVTNTGPTVIGPPSPAVLGDDLGGDLGVSPGTDPSTDVVGFSGAPNGTVLPPGVIHAGDGVALQAQTDLVTAYDTLAGEPCPPANLLPATVAGAVTLVPGVYCFTSAALFPVGGSLTLNLLGNPDSLFIFQIPSTLITEPGYPVNFINGGGGAPCNVWWQVGSSATLDTTTQFVGNIIALTSITMNTGATLSPGRALARNGAVTLDDNEINSAGCGILPATSTPRPTNTPVPPPTNTPRPTDTPTPTPSPTPLSLPSSVTELPSTGEHADYRLPLILLVSLLVFLMGAWLFSRRQKLR